MPPLKVYLFPLTLNALHQAKRNLGKGGDNECPIDASDKLFNDTLIQNHTLLQIVMVKMNK